MPIHHTLKAWQHAQRLAVECAKAANRFPDFEQLALADQLRRQAASLRRDQRRAVEERAARAAPKIQLVVALILVPSVLLMIAAALIANADVLLSGF